MKWIQEPGASKSHPASVLIVEAGEPIAPAWVEFWKRVLADGANLVPPSRFGLAIDIYARTFQADSTGEATANFRNSLNRDPDGIGKYVLRSEHFTLLQEKGEGDDAFGARQLVWFLEHYKLLKAALGEPQVWPLYQKLSGSQPLGIRLATINGWFDLHPGKKGFGALPCADQELLAGMKPAPADPMEELAAPILSQPPENALEALSAALIQYTPEHFRNIECTIQEGTEDGRRALLYRVECPQFPGDGTTVVSESVHRAATLLVQQLAPQPGTFPGLRIELNLRPDGVWQRSVKEG